MPLPILGILGALTPIVDKVVDNVFETEEEKAAAKAKLIALHQQGRLRETEVQLSAILAEAQSEDPWTSRARPSFLYLMYSIITVSFVGGFAGLFYPTEMFQVAANIKDMLGAIPEEMWWLFGAGYLGYTGARTLDKRKGNSYVEKFDDLRRG